MTDLLLGWALLAPLVTALLIFFLLFFKPQGVPQYLITCLALTGPAIAAIATLPLAYGSMYHGTHTALTLFQWLDVEALHIAIALQGDALSLAMMLFVAPVGFLIHIYATGYMNRASGYGRFFAWFNLFMFFMLLLILADNPLVMFIGWEGVGLCSYALISFYFKDPANVDAGNKAFILNRIGDFGFLSALMLLFVAIGEHGFTFMAIEAHLHEIPQEQRALIAFLFFVGAMGKSAQIPLYVWLPDAMAGPTPVSALIHAATMVTAGVYMVARLSPLYDSVPEVGTIIAYIGAFSALLAALIATRQNDIKKILAYSTMSQLGYMFMAAGLGGYSLAIFHVFTHAFFKALLFMGAGAIILAMHHEQDITKMGGLGRKMPQLFGMMLIATFALAAIPPFSGFFSKDAIMAHLVASDAYGLYLIALITAALTAFYMFRLLFYVFMGRRDHTPAEVPRSMTLPMGVLALGATFAGVANLPHLFGGQEPFSAWLAIDPPRPHLAVGTELLLLALGLGSVILAIYVAYRRYGAANAPRHDAPTNIWLQAIHHRFYVDAFYDHTIVKPLQRLSIWLDYHINHGAIDHNIHRLATAYVWVGERIKVFHNGNIRYYGFYMMCGISLFFIYFYLGLEH